MKQPNLKTSRKNLILALLTSLALVLSACGGNTTAPVQPDLDVSAPAGTQTDTSATDDDSLDANSDELAITPAPLDSAFDVPAGTQPGFVGSPYTADTFPLSEMVSVLPRDAIPAITDPEMIRSDQLDYLSDQDLVFGIVHNGEARAYPHNIGWWHEIVNDRIGGRAMAITFCPLTGTGLVFDAERSDGSRLNLGVSGLLYNTNLVMFDRDDDTLYPQIYASSISGGDKGTALTLMPVVETTWAAWKRLYPDTKVMAGGPYTRSRYTQYPYGDYRTNDGAFLFRIRPSLSSNSNDNAARLASKERVLGLRINAEARAYQFAAMGNQQVINDVLGDHELVVVYDEDSRMAIPYSRQLDGQVLSFDIVQDSSFPFSLRDNETGTLWDITGKAVEGELVGQQLQQIPAHNAMWFAWVTFWPNTDVWP